MIAFQYILDQGHTKILKLTQNSTEKSSEIY